MQAQDPNPNPPAPENDDPEAAMRDARQRFIAAFPKRSDSIGLLLGMVSTLGVRGPLAPLRQIVHRTAGLAGTLGFPTVSARTRELEELLDDVETKGLDATSATRLFEGISDGFAHDLGHPPQWVEPVSGVDGGGRRILVVEDDEDQREVVGIHLKAAGFEPIFVGEGDKAIGVARAQQPALILLDANLPGLDGYTVCRLLKADPELATTPVIFLTVRASLDDRLVGLMLGADDYMIKPVEMTELLLRIQLQLTRRAALEAPEPERAGEASPELDYESLSLVAREQLAQLPATLGLVRVPEDLMPQTYAALRGESRRRDLVARYDRTHIILFMAEMPPYKARERVSDILARGKAGTSRIKVGLSASAKPGSKTFETLLAEADEAITQAWQRGELAAIAGEPSGGAPAAAVVQPSPSFEPPEADSVPGPAPQFAPPPATSVAPDAPAVPPVAAVPSRGGTIVLADDDPEVSHLLDAHIRAAGYKTILAADGAAALEAVRAHKPDLLVIDVMMPRMTGIEVLARLVQAPDRPRIIVLSARGREQDVTRAFALGADDYVTKPFSPQDLMARVRRLLRY